MEQATLAGAADVRDTAAMTDLSLEGLYDRYSVMLYRYALALLGSREDAEDAVSDVFVRVARDTRKLHKVDNIKAYLYVATRNAAYGVLRSKRRREALSLAICAELITTTRDTALESAALCRAFAELPVEQREIVALKVYEQMTFREIAEVVRIPANTAASRYRYAIEKLRQALEVSEDG